MVKGHGFIIAQKDLEIRGPGDLIGTRQSGEPGNQFLFADVHLLDEVSQCVHELTRNPDRKAEVEAISSYAYSYFNAEGHTIALN